MIVETGGTQACRKARRRRKILPGS